jgi:hypothetical protein
MKKMKKFTLLFIFNAYVAVSNIYAQDFYLKAGVGYAFAMPGEKIDQSGNVLNGTVTNLGSGAVGYNIKNASFTSGVPLIIGGGLILSKNIAVELNAAIDMTPRDYIEIIDGQTNSSGVVYNYLAQRKANNSAIIMPTIVLQTANAKWNMYMRMGVALPVNTGIDLHETFAYQTGDVHQYDWSIKNYFSLGFTGATGVKVRITNEISFWGEVSMLYLNLSRKERDLNTAVINGVGYPASQLSGVTKYYYNKNGISDQNGNAQALSQPYSNLGTSIGITYTSLAKKRKQKFRAK